MENKVNDFFIKNVNYGHLIVFASIGFATCLYHSLKLLSNLKVDDLFPAKNRFSELIETDTESDTESESEPEIKIINESDNNTDYIQPKNYTIKLLKRKRN
jgi:hypothetical protein